MDDSKKGKGTAQLVAFEASAGTKGGGDNCNDLAIWRDVNANAHAGMSEGKGDLSGSDEVALKKKKNREKQARYHANMSAEKHAQEQESLDSIRANETEAQCDERKRKECKQSAARWQNLTDEMRAKRRKYMCDYMGKKMSKATLPPSSEEEEADAMADPPPSPEQDAEVMESVDILTTLNKASSYET
jgi:hypothetical protein